jgi:polyisoprenoid-binding protein YceI
MRRQFVLAVLLLLGSATPAWPIVFVIHPGTSSQVQFVSKAPMETVTGKTRTVSGSVQLDPAALGDSIVVHVEVDLASLDTGIEMRNKHMRENHLQTATYPKAVFEGGRLQDLSAPRLTEGQTVTGSITGTLDLHGKRQPLQASLELTLQGGALHAVTHFKVKLVDYDIPRPQFLVMRLDETQSVTADLTARPAE